MPAQYRHYCSRQSNAASLWALQNMIFLQLRYQFYAATNAAVPTQTQDHSTRRAPCGQVAQRSSKLQAWGSLSEPKAMRV
eukprot:CAMPEP_0178387344 /NCGR_PEP_ID=MMETSP0689_2-20121128/9027_1 /TAXON_ID=160604 /ORGANISM="Amphidinium massartii, Strain CS-259" /LENGTH=79 /DNA_ID=CAMNT_0020007709 /DNA_START=780 /DNA_END=1016 /DNA_ORIENTATION=-